MEGFRHLCVGDNQAAFVCVNPQCEYKVPLLCENYTGCSCQHHFHNSKQTIVRIKDFTDRVNGQYPKSVVDLRQDLRSRLQIVRKEIESTLKEQENRIELLVAELLQHCGKGTATVIRSYKDIEDRSGRELRAMLERQPENFLIPDRITTSINTVLVAVNEQLRKLLDVLKKVVPLNTFVDKKADVRRKIKLNIDRKELAYEGVFAPFPEVLDPEFSDVAKLVLDGAISDPSFLRHFNSYASESLKILSLNQNNLGNAEILCVCQARLPNLVEFKAFINQIGDVGAEHIAKANWPYLGYFNLHSNQITTKGAEKLLKRYASNLFRFDLDYNNITDDLYAVVTQLKWPKLTEVHLGTDLLTADGNHFEEKSRTSLHKFFREKFNVQTLYILTEQ